MYTKNASNGPKTVKIINLAKVLKPYSSDFLQGLKGFQLPHFLKLVKIIKKLGPWCFKNADFDSQSAGLSWDCVISSKYFIWECLYNKASRNWFSK